MMKKRENALLLIIFVFLLLSLFVVNNCINLQKQLEEKDSCSHQINKAFLFHLSQNSINIGDECFLYDVDNNDSITIESLYRQGYVLGLFVDRSQCVNCWQKAMAYLHDSKVLDNKKVFIVFSNYSKREYKLLRRNSEISYKTYLLEEFPLNFIQSIDITHPFYFMPKSNGCITNIFYPDGLYDSIGEIYLKNIELNYSETDATGSILVENPVIDLGRIHLREKRSVSFRLKNIGKRTLRITDVFPSCDCLVLTHVPSEIQVGESDEIRADLLSITKGKIVREIIFNEDSVISHSLQIIARII